MTLRKIFIMLNHWHKISLVIVFSLAAINLSAQMKRVVAYHETPQSTPQYLEVYDCDFVDEQPQFPGGEVALIKYINDSRRYPAEAYDRRIQGRVLCGFIVNPDGEISHVSVIRGVEPSLNHEAVRLISNMPRWEAGKVNHTPVPVYYILPIAFRR